MALSTVKASFPYPVKDVWDVVTSLDHYSWRRDLSRIEVAENGRRFVEYTKEGYSTNFTITAFKPYERYEFNLENENMTGHFTAVFTFSEKETTLELTEDLAIKKWFMKPIAKVFLKKQQTSYVNDLSVCLSTLDGLPDHSDRTIPLERS